MSRNKCRIKKDDRVVVTAGRDKGKIGRVLRVVPADRKVFVEGVRVVKRHQRPVGEQPGGIVEKEAAIDISNVALFDETSGRRIKVGFTVLEDGRKVRVDRKTGQPIDQV